MTLARFFRFVQYLLYALEGAVFIYAILSWFRPRFSAYRWLETVVAPVLKPFRRLNEFIMRRSNLPIDFSCLFAILGIQLANGLWHRLYLILRTIRGR